MIVLQMLLLGILAAMPALTTVKGPPGDLITVTFGDKTFMCSKRTYAHLLFTQDQLKKVFPDAYIHVMQGSYHAGYLPSAGTHDFDACLDIRVVGLDWWVAQKFMRQCGWAAWYRYTGTFSGTNQHIHMVSIPPMGAAGAAWVARVGIYVPGQLADYLLHTFGLKGQHNVDLDKSWFPGDGDKADPKNPNAPVGTPAGWRTAIIATIFDYPKWLNDQEDNMGYRDWDQADKDAFMSDFWAYKPKGADSNVSQLVKQAANAPGLIRSLASALGKKLT